MIRVASVQLEISGGETKDERVDRVAREVGSMRGTDLVLLPEVWNVGYFNFDRYATEAEPLDGRTVTRLGEAARSAGAWVLVGSIIEGSEGRLFNTSVLLDRGGEVRASYRKIHLFGYGSREHELLARGGQPAVADTELGRIGLATCYDLRFPELFRAMVDDGAELFLVTSAWPYPRVEAWTMLNRVRAHENLAWLISANCAGGDPVPCCGRSMIVDPWGTAVAAAGDRPAVLTAEIDPAAAAAARADFPALRDRVFETGRMR
ncbi:MAG: carbon-nitrogen family hydrolase [Solirubrobacteraceae bacterium]